MTILHTPGMLIAYGLLVASLTLPSAVFAGKPDKTNGELAPGFNICEKRAADSAKSSAEYKEALLGCLDSAEKYWEGIIQERNDYYIELYEGISMSQERQQTVKDFQKAWLKYKEIGIDLVRADGDPMATIRARYFEVQETRRQAKLLTNGLCLEIEEELAPGFDMCDQKAAEATSGQGLAQYRGAKIDCYDLADKYWTPILNKNYDIHMNLYKDDPDKQKKLQEFQKAWEQYVDAGRKFIYAQGGTMAGTVATYFDLEETRRQARLLDGTGLRW